MLFPSLPTVTWKTPIPLAFTTAAPESGDEISQESTSTIYGQSLSRKAKHLSREGLNSALNQSLRAFADISM